MRFAVGLSARHPLPLDQCSGTFLRDLAQTVEGAGFDAIYVTEHPMPGDGWLADGGHDALDPFVALATMAAATTSLRLLTNLTVLPYRNPFMLAKAAATLDRMSDGRLILGAGVGYLEPEFRALGVEFEHRNRLADETLGVLRSAWSGTSVNASGVTWQAAGNTSWPPPVQDPVPVWLGGNAGITLRRVARHAQGWLPLPNPRVLGARRRSRSLDGRDDLARYLDELRVECEAIGRTDPLDIAFMVFEGGGPSSDRFDADAHHVGLAANADLGVTWNLTGAAGDSPTAVLEAVERYGREIIGGSR